MRNGRVSSVKARADSSSAARWQLLHGLGQALAEAFDQAALGGDLAFQAAVVLFAQLQQVAGTLLAPGQNVTEVS